MLYNGIVMSNFFEELKKYLAKTPKDEILETWKKSEKMDQVGVTVEEFLTHHQNYEYIYSSDPAPWNQNITINNLSPKFSSDFFLYF